MATIRRPRDRARARRARQPAVELPATPWFARSTTSRSATARATSSPSPRRRWRSTLDGNRIRAARVALGGVGSKPWRSPEAEQALAGARAEETWRAAAEAALRGARPQKDNGFKIELAKRTLARALATAAEKKDISPAEILDQAEQETPRRPRDPFPLAVDAERRRQARGGRQADRPRGRPPQDHRRRPLRGRLPAPWARLRGARAGRTVSKGRSRRSTAPGRPARPASSPSSPRERAAAEEAARRSKAQPLETGKTGEDRLPLSDNVIPTPASTSPWWWRYTLEHARHAAVPRGRPLPRGEAGARLHGGPVVPSQGEHGQAAAARPRRRRDGVGGPRRGQDRADLHDAGRRPTTPWSRRRPLPPGTATS